MIYIGVIGLAAILGLAARRASRGDGASQYFLISTVPLVLTIVVPLPFVLATGGPAGWARMAVVAVSRVGVGLSVILAAIGIVLTLRAALADDRRTALLLSLETALVVCLRESPGPTQR
ncbi:MAG TPA: hypothetical protein VFJ02_14420 [Vicinamibacterales bacterium]|nr:hypothetical protein [Vicinamibacterales bacterium]